MRLWAYVILFVEGCCGCLRASNNQQLTVWEQSKKPERMTLRFGQSSSRPPLAPHGNRYSNTSTTCVAKTPPKLPIPPRTAHAQLTACGAHKRERIHKYIVVQVYRFHNCGGPTSSTQVQLQIWTRSLLWSNRLQLLLLGMYSNCSRGWVFGRAVKAWPRVVSVYCGDNSTVVAYCCGIHGCEFAYDYSSYGIIVGWTTTTHTETK